MFSVIMPVYNGAAFVAEAINSICAQTEKDWELLVINDGSTDDTLSVLNQCAAQDDRIHVISQPNGGVAAARNTGIWTARGAYLAFLDADDLWYPGYLAEVRRLTEAYPQAGLIGMAYDIRLQNGELTDTCGYFEGKPQEIYLEDFFAAYAEDKRAKCYNMLSTCIKTEAARQAGGFRTGCKIGEDLALSLWISAHGPVVLSGKPLSLYNKMNSTASRDTSFDPDWYFFEEAEQLMSDPSIPASRRENLRRVMAWFRIRRVRHYLIDGRKKDARRAYSEIGPAPALAKDKLITRILLCLPCKLTRKIFLLRWRTQA